VHGVGSSYSTWVTAMRFQFTCEGCRPGDCERVSVSRKVRILKSNIYLLLYFYILFIRFETLFTLKMIHNSPPPSFVSPGILYYKKKS